MIYKAMMSITACSRLSLVRFVAPTVVTSRRWQSTSPTDSSLNPRYSRLAEFKNGNNIMLTKCEAIDFIVDKLKIKEPLKIFSENRLVLLNSIIRAIHHKLPFHNITMLCQPKNDRRPPTINKIKRDCLSLVGGGCPVISVFTKYLLETIGFDIDFVSGTVSNPNSHMICLVKNVLHKGDEYIVDAACGYPTFEAIPLDFKDESPIYKFSFLTLKLVRKHEIIERQHFHKPTSLVHLGSNPTHDNLTGQWVRFYHFSPTPVDYSHFKSPLHIAYTVPGANPFLISIVLVFFKNDKCSVVKNNLHLEEGDDNKLHVVERLESKESMIACISKIYPHLPELELNKAVEMWETEIKPTLK